MDSNESWRGIYGFITFSSWNFRLVAICESFTWITSSHTPHINFSPDSYQQHLGIWTMEWYLLSVTVFGQKQTRICVVKVTQWNILTFFRLWLLTNRIDSLFSVRHRLKFIWFLYAKNHWHINFHSIAERLWKLNICNRREFTLFADCSTAGFASYQNR